MTILRKKCKEDVRELFLSPENANIQDYVSEKSAKVTDNNSQE